MAAATLSTRRSWPARLLHRLRAKLLAMPIRWDMLGNSYEAAMAEELIARHLATLEGPHTADQAATARAQIHLNQIALIRLDAAYQRFHDRLLELGETP